MKKALFIIAHEGFQPLEYSVPKKILEDAGVKVVTASDAGMVAISSKTAEKAKVDLVLDEVRAADYDGVFFIGGPGAEKYLENERAYKIAREATTSGKILGAICHSPRILAHAGVLEGKKTTGWNEDGKLPGILSAVGARFMPDPVFIDGNLITARDPQASEEFGRKILEKLI